MADQSLRDLLLRLRQELEKLDGGKDLDPESRALIFALEKQIHNRLKLPLDELEDDTLLERLQEAVVELGTSHSTLTAAINHVVTALTNMGL